MFSLEIVNLDLTKRIEWGSKQFAGVPVLETDSVTLEESLDICQFLDGIKPNERPMLPKNAEDKEKERRLVERFQKVNNTNFHKLF